MYLNAHSYYSFKYGTLPLEELLELAQGYGINELALTDINATAGSLNFVRLAKKAEIKPILGIDFRKGNEQKFIGIARSNEGFHELNEYLSQHLHEDKDFPDRAPVFKHAFVIYPFRFDFDWELEPHEYLGIRPRDMIKFSLTKWSKQLDKLVVLQTVSFREGKVSFNMHRLLRAMDQNTLLSKLSKAEEGHLDDVMYPLGKLLECYRDYPEIIVNTKRLFDRCEIDFEFGNFERHQNIKTYTGSDEEDWEMLADLCEKGLPYRYGDHPKPEIHERLEKELDLIRSKGFISYFLVNWDILNYARKMGYYYVGRGSGANSIVAYLLRITDVDPVDLDLYFERFINLFRQNPPDFDIDFSWKDRDDITRYIFDRFGQSDDGLKVALLATYSTFQHRAVMRELGKVFGLPGYEIEKIAAEEDQSKLDHIGRLIHRYSERLKDFPSHLSIHAGGILISDKPIHYFTATSLPPKGYPLTHFDMIVAEDVGLYKFDILSQRGLGKIKDSLEVIAKNCPDVPPIDIHDFKRFKEDPTIRERLMQADAIGCFYIESPAMRMLLKKLQVKEYMGLVAASSIIRPGVAKSGMMREYILRYRYPERRKEAHPVLWEIMPDTYGVMVYQEDVIKVAHYFAKLTLGEADVLRRGMSGKYRSRDEFQKARDKYFENCKDLGHPYELAADVWRQIESFAGYAFAKGHSASYAVESYQALFLKTYYPLEYMVAVINNGGGFYRVEFYVHEARMQGAEIEAPCVNHSEGLAVILGKTIYLGLGMVKGLNHDIIEKILQEREVKGQYLDLDDFIERVKISLEQIKLLVRIGALRFCGLSKKEILWQVHFIFGSGVSREKHQLFHTPMKSWKLPVLHQDPRENAFDEMDLLGFPLCSPFDLLEADERGILSRQLPDFLGKNVTMVGYLVAIKNTGTSGGKRMNFGTFVDREGQFIDTVHFPPSAAAWPFRGSGVYRLQGKVVEEFDFYCLEVNRMEKLQYVNMEKELLSQTIRETKPITQSNRFSGNA